MDEREYKRRVEAKRRIISPQELERQERIQNQSANHGAVSRSNQKNKNTTSRATHMIQEKNKREFGRFAVTVVGLAIAIFLVAFYLLFCVRQIEVTENEYTSSQEVIDWLSEDVALRNSISTYIKYNYMDVELPLQIEELNVRFINPWTLSVQSIDRTPMAGFVLGGLYVYCDIEGVVILESEVELEDLPLIEGIVVEEYTIFEIVELEDMDIFKNALEVTNILNNEGVEFDEISCHDGAQIDVTIGGICIELGESGYQEKIVQIEPILSEIGEDEGTLDLKNYSTTNTTITFQRNISEN